VSVVMALVGTQASHDLSTSFAEQEHVPPKVVFATPSAADNAPSATSSATKSGALPCPECGRPTRGLLSTQQLAQLVDQLPETIREPMSGRQDQGRQGLGV
jgi:hypothetical protein